MTTNAYRRRRTLNMRIKPDVCDRASRALLSVSEDAYRKFLARLDAPPKPNAQLRKTMRTPARWDRV